jgi:hypothetical protein
MTVKAPGIRRELFYWRRQKIKLGCPLTVLEFVVRYV